MWNLPQAQHRVYRRNPLELVVAELRFHPILRVSDNVSGFQDRIRVDTAFVDYQAVATEGVNVHLTGAQPSAHVVPIPSQVRHQFLGNDRSALTLSTDSLTLQYYQHESSHRIFSDAAVVVEALRAEYAPVKPKRLGLRYINNIERDVIVAHETLDWADILSAEFAHPPVPYLDMDGTLFYSQVSSPIDPGVLTLGFGLVRDQGTGSPRFRIDIDRSLTGSFPLDDVESLLKSFSADIFALFDKACGPALRKWMEG